MMLFSKPFVRCLTQIEISELNLEKLYHRKHKNEADKVHYNGSYPEVDALLDQHVLERSIYKLSGVIDEQLTYKDTFNKR